MEEVFHRLEAQHQQWGLPEKKKPEMGAVVILLQPTADINHKSPSSKSPLSFSFSRNHLGSPPLLIYKPIWNNYTVETTMTTKKPT